MTRLIQRKIIKFMIKIKVRIFCPNSTTVMCFYKIVAFAADERRWMQAYDFTCQRPSLWRRWETCIIFFQNLR